MKCKECNREFERSMYGYVREGELICGLCAREKKDIDLIEEINDMFIQDEKRKKILVWKDWQRFLKRRTTK